MAKLFIFGIGGTGSRVIKSLAMLLASGVELKNTTEVIPIIIDPDKANGDLTRTIEILNYYKAIREKIVNSFNYKKQEIEKNKFFKIPVISFNNVSGREFRYKLNLTSENLANNKFRNYIDYDTIEGINKIFASILFSGYHKDKGKEKELFELETDIGVKGNPQLGSVLLNQFNNTNEDFVKFANNYAEGDRIFIISSIFGGTGAAGFPLLLKNIRNANKGKDNDRLPNSALLEKSLIGAITVLPYFKLKAGDIDSQDFVSKTKAALEYYIKNVNPSLNSLYYIAYDNNIYNYDNNPGGGNQQNPAHFTELASALAIIDFMKQPDNDLKNKKYYKEFGIDDFALVVNFTHLGQNTQRIIKKALSQYKYFTFYLEKQLNSSLNKQPWSNRGKIKINKKFINDNFYLDLLKFNKEFNEWLSELSGNNPSFSPFNLAVDSSNIFEMINDCDVDTSWWKPNFAIYNEYLNITERKIGNPPVEQKFISIFYTATHNLLAKKFNF